MLESNNSDINIEKLLEKVGVELKLYQKKVDEENHNVDQDIPVNDPYSWGQLTDTLNIAEQNVNAGAQVTTMLHYRGIVRKIAKVLGKIVVFLGRVITIPQRNFNAAILHSQRITLDGIRNMNRDTAEMQMQLRRMDKKFVEYEKKLQEKSNIINYLKSNLVSQERRVSILLKELRSQTSDKDQPVLQESLEKVPDIHDPLYLAFEDQFRGTREEIRERLMEFVPRIRESNAGEEGREILDIGCGRGEWLEIMRDEGLLARGVDLNDVLVEQCRNNGFETVKNDALSYLKSLPDNSLGAVTSFHLIEHIDFDTRIELFDECLRVIKTGGFALFETPNPQNLLVGSCNFWADPTHMRPLYPETHKFLLEYRGFCDVELLYLHPHEEDQRLPEQEAPQLATRLNELFSCARDYAIVGYKV